MAKSGAVVSVATSAKKLVEALGFESTGKLYTLMIGSSKIKVDFADEKIVYPSDLVVHDRTTLNFSHLENLVVLECIVRLLRKGYVATSLELEPRWQLGHGSSGGKADVLIRDREGSPLVIIECKTPGAAFTRAWNDTRRTGAQLFSYAQQTNEVQFLCLYSSSWDEGIEYSSYLISHQDNADYLLLNPDLQSFSNASDVEARFSVWRDTYKLGYTPFGLFEEQIPAYQIGKERYTLSDLRALGAEEERPKLAEFATILRQHNISARENAFDKLINLLLCKLVDELDNPDDLKFFWKGVAYETHFDLLDRLQQLYQAGMARFLREDITYINEDDLSRAMRFVKNDPDATRRAVWQLFVKQKFYTNNDFSLIDVHNEHLFYENAEVLLRLIEMWQTVRLTEVSNNNQFLGDLFEGFLDQGIKQTEGQFFTPKPLCTFMLQALPLPSLMERVGTPKSIDYACGAGHFVNELADQLTALSPGTEEVSDRIQGSIFGIEKEYRLSKVAKVAAFMHGHRHINIAYIDGLTQNPSTFPDVQNGTFDLLVANPPYSVRGFLETLPEADAKKYELSRLVDKPETFDGIELFFVERAAQLLSPGGVAAIILPSSFVANGNRAAQRAREILLSDFEIISIVSMGNRTFGKTGTSTVILFLRRRQSPPEAIDHYKERVERWFDDPDGEDADDAQYLDRAYIDRYASRLRLEPDDVVALMRRELTEKFESSGLGQAYVRSFNRSPDLKRLQKSRVFVSSSEEDRATLTRRALIDFIRQSESLKMVYFVLADSQGNDVLMLSAPTGTAEQKIFLGYGWSDSRGGEGIQLHRDSFGKHMTPMYDPADRDSSSHLASYIAANFADDAPDLPESLSDHGFRAPLTSLLDFDRDEFKLEISTGIPVERAEDIYRWPIELLTNAGTVKKGSSITAAQTRPGDVKVVAGGRTHAFTHDTANRSGDVITVSASGASAGHLNLWREPIFASDCTTVQGVDDTHTRFLFYVLRDRQEDLFRLARGSAQPHVYPRQLEVLGVPKVDDEIVGAIVRESDAIEASIVDAQTRVDKLERALQAHIDEVASAAPAARLIRELSVGSPQYGLNLAMDAPGQVADGYKIFRMNELIEGRAVDNGRMKTVSLSAKEFAAYQLSRGDILFNRTNSLEHVGKSGLVDLDGAYCFASYLLRISPDREVVDPHFLSLMMMSTSFLRGARAVATPSINQANINAVKLSELSVPYLRLEEQARVISTAVEMQDEIIEERLRIAELMACQSELIARHLRVPAEGGAAV